MMLLAICSDLERFLGIRFSELRADSLSRPSTSYQRRRTSSDRVSTAEEWQLKAINKKNGRSRCFARRKTRFS
jgi:hypothetical protein